MNGQTAPNAALLPRAGEFARHLADPRSGRPLKLLVCVPTYNEAENITPFLAAVFENAPDKANVLVIDDNSPDGTAGIVENLKTRYGGRLSLVTREGKQGGATAFLLGFSRALEGGYDAALAMDADFSHKPEYIPLMLAKAKDADVVIGSRLAPGGGIENRSFLRNLISAGASLYCRAVLDARIKDWTGGYNLWSRQALAAINPQTVVTRGYSFQLEMKYKALRAGCTVAEIPIIFPDRAAGVSKMPFSYFVKELFDVPRIKIMCLPESVKQFLKFAFTGGLGTITNLLIFFLCADIARLPEVPVSIGCFIITSVQNYLVNHRWSFRSVTGASKPSVQNYAAFVCASLAGLAVNIAVMTLIIRSFALPYKFIAQAAGIAAGMVVNLVVSKLVVFRRNK